MDSICQYYYHDPFTKKKQHVHNRQEDTPDGDDFIDNRNHEPIRRGALFSITLDYGSCDDLLVDKPRNNILHLFNRKAAVQFQWLKKRDRKRKRIPSKVLDALGNKLSWFNNGCAMSRIVSVKGFTEIRMNCEPNYSGRTILRAHPDYRGKGQWLDWIDVCWDINTVQDEGENDVTILPAKVVLMLDFDTAEYAPIPDNLLKMFQVSPFVLQRRIHEKREGIHILVHSANIPVNDGDGSASEDETFQKMTYSYCMEPVYQFITVENIKQLTFVAPDPPHNSNIGQGRTNTTAVVAHPLVYRITKVSRPKSWPTSFEHKFSKNYSSPHNHDLHLDEFNETFHPWL
jgi:hypothetical protein